MTLLSQEEQDRMLAEYLALQESQERVERQDQDDDSDDDTRDQVFSPTLHGVLAYSPDKQLLAFAGKIIETNSSNQADEDKTQQEPPMQFSFVSARPVEHWDSYNLTVASSQPPNKATKTTPTEEEPLGTPPPSRMVSLEGTLGKEGTTPHKVSVTLRVEATPDMTVGPNPALLKKPPPEAASAADSGDKSSSSSQKLLQQKFEIMGWGQEEDQSNDKQPSDTSKPASSPPPPFSFQFNGTIPRAQPLLTSPEGIQSIPFTGKITMQVGEDTRKQPAEELPPAKRPRVKDSDDK